jgi:hypothetical protein
MNDLKDQLIDALSQQIGLLSAQNTYLNLLVKSLQTPAPADVQPPVAQPAREQAAQPIDVAPVVAAPQPQPIESIGTPTAEAEATYDNPAVV